MNNSENAHLLYSLYRLEMITKDSSLTPKCIDYLDSRLSNEEKAELLIYAGVMDGETLWEMDRFDEFTNSFDLSKWDIAKILHDNQWNFNPYDKYFYCEDPSGDYESFKDNEDAVERWWNIHEPLKNTQNWYDFDIFSPYEFVNIAKYLIEYCQENDDEFDY